MNVEPLENCVSAFVRRDYPQAVLIAMDLLKTGVNPGLSQILLISMRRMGVLREVQDIGSALLAAAKSDPWQSAFLQLTMGQREPGSILEEAHEQLHRCQALCYVGSHLLTTGDLVKGKKFLQECREMNVDCFERHIASMETEMVDQWIASLAEPAGEVDRLRRMFVSLRSNGHHQQSVHIAHLALSIILHHHGEYHPDTGHCLNELAMAYIAIENYEQAEPLLSKALQLVTIFDGASSEACAAIVDNLALLKGRTGQLQEAEKLHRTALDLFAQATGKDHPSYATCLGNLAMVCRKLGKYAESERLYLQAIDIRRLIFGTDDVRYVGMLDGLTALYVEMGRLRGAEVRVKEVIEIVGRKVGHRSPEYGSRLKQLANLYHQLGQHSESAALLHRAMKIDEEAFGQEHPATLDTIARMSLEQKLAGQLGDAFRGYQYVMAKQSEHLGSTHPQLATTKQNLGQLYLDLGQPFHARRLLEEAIEIRRSANGEDTVEYAMTLLGMAAVESFENKHREAERMIRRTLEIVERRVGREHEYFAKCCDALAECCIVQKRFDEADSLLELSLAIMEKTLGTDTPALGLTLGLRGVVQAARGRWASAEELLRRGVSLLGQVTDAERDPAYIRMLGDFGSVLVAVEQEPEAIDVFMMAERYQDRLIEEKFTVAGISPSLVDLPVGLLSLLRDPKLQSPGLVSQLLDIVWHRKSIVTEAELIRKREEIQSRRDDGSEPRHTIDMLLRRLQNGEVPQVAELNEILEAFGRPQRYKLYPQLGAAQGELNAEIMKGWPEQGELSRDAWLEKLREYVGGVGGLMGKRDDLDSQLRYFLPDEWLAKFLQRVSIQAVVSQLPEQSALVEFLRVPSLNARAVQEKGESRWGPPRYYAFVLHSGSPEDIHLIDLGDAEAIDEKIRLFRSEVIQGGPKRALQWRAMASSEQRETVDGVGTDLRRALFDPLQNVFADRRRLFLAPDAQLCTLPFEILPLDWDRRVIDDYETTYLATARDLIRIPDAFPEPSTHPVVIADPAYDLADSEPSNSQLAAAWTEASGEQVPVAEDHYENELRRAGLHFNQLPGTRIEGQRIANLLGVEAWLGADALEARIKQQRSPLVLHIASHGYFLEDHLERADGEFVGAGYRTLRAYPMPLLNSGIALAGANTWLRHGDLPELAEDGLLTAADMATIDLSRTELVVLSACDTGLGEIAVGQGVYGLRRAVGIAGARTLVMSLWNVPDKETQELMVDFYSRLKRGESRSAAFRAAQLGMKARKPDPYYWGAFICQGDSGTVPVLQDVARNS